MKGYIYILNGKVVINPEEMPEPLERLPEGHEENELIEIHEKYDNKEWESNCIEAENVWIDNTLSAPRIKITTVINEADYEQTLPEGSRVEHDGPVITKII